MVRRKHRSRWFWRLLLLVLVAVGVWHTNKPLPNGINYAGATRPAVGVQFLADLTYLDADGERHSEQQIFDALFDMIAAAERFILVDMFLFNSAQGEVREEQRALASELTDKLIAQHQRFPDMQILLITDPINSAYGSIDPKNLMRLRESGISVTETKLTALRDSNPIYSSIWRSFIGYWGNGPGDALPNLVGEGRVSVRSYLSLMNFKANHRKVAIADNGDEYLGLVTSGNPHDGSSAHGNVALLFSGPAVADLLESEIAVLEMSGGPLPEIEISAAGVSQSTLQIVTEGAIEQALLESIRLARTGDQLDLAVFYLSDRDIISALKNALLRDVQLRILLDPNKDAFGRAKNGIPNRQTAHELEQAGAEVRWCDTNGEQCHSKVLLAEYADGSRRLVLGSANYTRRNLDNLNLESSVLLQGNKDMPTFVQAEGWFDMRWSNSEQRQFSIEYEAYADESRWRRLMYRLMEATGLSTF